jgi:hypothetical protein
MNFFEKKDPSILLATLLELIIKIWWRFGKTILEYLTYLSHFSNEKSFVLVKIIFLGSKFNKKLLVKKMQCGSFYVYSTGNFLLEMCNAQT